MAKTITEATDQQSTGLDRVKSRADRHDSGDGGASKGLQLGGQITRLRTFLGDVRAEMRKVITPSRAEVQSTTTIVIVTVFVFAAYFALIDYVCGTGIQWLFTHLTKH